MNCFDYPEGFNDKCPKPNTDPNLKKLSVYNIAKNEDGSESLGSLVGELDYTNEELPKFEVESIEDLEIKFELKAEDLNSTPPEVLTFDNVVNKQQIILTQDDIISLFNPDFKKRVNLFNKPFNSETQQVTKDNPHISPGANRKQRRKNK